MWSPQIIVDVLFTLSVLVTLCKLLELVLPVKKQRKIQGWAENMAIRFDDVQQRWHLIYSLRFLLGQGHGLWWIAMLLTIIGSNEIASRPHLLEAVVKGDDFFVLKLFTITMLIYVALAVLKISKNLIGRLIGYTAGTTFFVWFICMSFLETARLMYPDEGTPTLSWDIILAFTLLFFGLFMSAIAIREILGQLLRLSLWILGSLLWRVAEYQQGALAAVSLLVTIILGIAGLWLRYPHL